MNIIWNNCKIRIDNKPVHYKNYYEAGIVYTQDLLFNLNVSVTSLCEFLIVTIHSFAIRCFPPFKLIFISVVVFFHFDFILFFFSVVYAFAGVVSTFKHLFGVFTYVFLLCSFTDKVRSTSSVACISFSAFS